MQSMSGWLNKLFMGWVGPDSSMRGSAPPMHVRIFLSLAVGVLSAFICHGILTGRHVLAADFTWPWRAARILQAGHDPYSVIQPTGHYPFSEYFLYPLPAAIVSLPFAGLEPVIAGALFVGISSALMTFAITRNGYQWLPLLVSAPFIKVVLAPEWSPLLLAAALIPSLQFLAVTKPNLGVAALVYNPTRLGAIGCLAFLLVSVAVFPRWPLEWLKIVTDLHSHAAPYRQFVGPVLLVSALRLGTREGRLLFAMAILPQELLVYDQLMLWLIPRRWWSSLLLSILSWPALAAWVSPSLFGVPQSGTRRLTEHMTMLFIYMPMLYTVFRRRNEWDGLRIGRSWVARLAHGNPVVAKARSGAPAPAGDPDTADTSR